MKYTARTISKNIFNGILTVEVEFRSEDGKDIFNDKFQTLSSQDSDWLANCVNKRILDLEGLHSFLESISINTEFTGLKQDEVLKLTPLKNTDPKKQEYKNDLETFNLWKKAYVNGHIEINNSDFVNLQNKLKKNFKQEYLDLYK